MKTMLFSKAIHMVVVFGIIIGLSLSLMPLSVSATSLDNPWINVHLLENGVDSHGWPDNSTLTLTIDGGIDPYTIQPPVIEDPWGNTYGFSVKLGTAFGLNPGQIVSVSNGITTQTMTVMDLYVDSYNPTEKTIAGHSDPNVVVRVDMWVGSGISQEVTADETGSWEVQFDASVDPFSPFIGGTAASSDEDGDVTQYQINMGRMTARTDWPGADNIFYVICSPARSYTLSIDDPSNGPGVDYESTQPCTHADWGTYMNFILGEFVLDVGDQVTVASGHHIRTLVVTPKGAISFDTINDVISGVNQPNNYLAVTTPEASRTIKTGPDGKWSIDYKVPGPNGEPAEDIVPGMSGNVAEYDLDGDDTTYGWQVPYLTFMPILVNSGSTATIGP